MRRAGSRVAAGLARVGLQQRSGSHSTVLYRAQQSPQSSCMRHQHRDHMVMPRCVGEGPLRVHWVAPDGRTSSTTKCREGQSLREVAQQNGLNVEAACEGAGACSTCHVVVDQGWYSKLGPVGDWEEDHLDQVFEQRPTSRLACQVKMAPHLDGMVVRLPRAQRNLYVDGHRPPPRH
eukprot:Hpha_TRINITY_DN13106_c0_g1::TRINITY_DN13106_c0_g1_i1::g.113773::m.113773